MPGVWVPERFLLVLARHSKTTITRLSFKNQRNRDIRMRKVSIIQREIPHYRIRFFEELYVQGKARGLDIHVYSGPSPSATLSSLTFPCDILSLDYMKETG